MVKDGGACAWVGGEMEVVGEEGGGERWDVAKCRKGLGSGSHSKGGLRPLRTADRK